MPKSTRGGKRMSNSQGSIVMISKEQDVWSERHNKRQEASVDQILSATRDMNDEYGIMDNVETVTIANMDKGDVIAFYSGDQNKMVVNRKFTNLNTIQKSYENCVQNGFHPPLGKRTPLEAVTAHELGHAIADKINEARRRVNPRGIDANSQIVIDAFKSTHKNVTSKALFAARRGISKYATENYHETIAEAVADVYCNGNKAKKFSRDIVKELKATMKREL